MQRTSSVSVSPEQSSVLLPPSLWTLSATTPDVPPLPGADQRFYPAQGPDAIAREVGNGEQRLPRSRMLKTSAAVLLALRWPFLAASFGGLPGSMAESIFDRGAPVAADMTGDDMGGVMSRVMMGSSRWIEAGVASDRQGLD